MRKTTFIVGVGVGSHVRRRRRLGGRTPTKLWSGPWKLTFKTDFQPPVPCQLLLLKLRAWSNFFKLKNLVSLCLWSLFVLLTLCFYIISIQILLMERTELQIFGFGGHRSTNGAAITVLVTSSALIKPEQILSELLICAILCSFIRAVMNPFQLKWIFYEAHA